MRSLSSPLLTFGVKASGSSEIEALRITSAGKVGINEDVPQSVLHVASTSNYSDIGLSNSTSGHTGSDGANIFLNNSLELGLWNRESTGIIRFATAGTERLRIDANGMIGIGGVTPKTQNTFDAIEFGKTGFLGSQTAARTVEMVSNAYYNSGWKYKEADVATQYYQYSGYHAWTTAASGSADGAITFVERMRIDSSGRVLIGDSDADQANSHFDDLVIGANASTTETHGLTIVCGNAATNGGIAFSDGSNGGADAYRGMISYQHNDNHMQFRTNGTERVRIDSSGNLLVGTSSVPTSYIGANTLAVIDDSDVNAAVIEVGGTNNGNNYNAGSIQFINNANSNYATAWDAGSRIVHIIRSQIVTSDNNAGDDSGADLVFYRKPEAGAGTEGFRIKSDGDVSIANGNLIVADGHGINFSATGDGTGSSQAELFADYETGTWSPANQYLPMSNIYAQWYTRVGNIVTCGFDFQYAASPADTSQTGSFIEGLPFTSSSPQHSTAQYAVFNADFTPSPTMSGNIMYVAVNGTNAYIYYVDGGRQYTRGECAGKRVIGTFTYNSQY